MKISGYEGRVPDIPGMEQCLEAVRVAGLDAQQLAAAAEYHPALAKILSLDILGEPGDSLLLRAAHLDVVITDVVRRLGEEKLVRTADALLGVSQQYRGQDEDQRNNTAGAIWRAPAEPYLDIRNFWRPRKRILRKVAGEVALLQSRYLKDYKRTNATISGDDESRPALPPRRQRRRALVAISTALAVAIGTVLFLTVGQGGHASSFSPPASARAIEQRYDGKDPEGKDGPQSRCVDLHHPSQPVTQIEPSVVGPDGKIVGHVQLRTSPICPVIWARVYWTKGSYLMPPGWSLHIVAVRRSPPRVADFIAHDASQYVYGNMLATVRGCVYAQAYFTDGSQRTKAAITPCMRSS